MSDEDQAVAAQPPPPPAAPPAPPKFELRITASMPLPPDALAQSRVIAALDAEIEQLRAALRAESLASNVDVQVVRVKQPKGGAK